MELGDFAFAAKLRDLMSKTARTEIDSVFPHDQFGVVVETDETTNRAYVVMPGSPDLQSVGYGFGDPPDPGTTVRITGRTGSRYIAANGSSVTSSDVADVVSAGVVTASRGEFLLGSLHIESGDNDPHTGTVSWDHHAGATIMNLTDPENPAFPADGGYHISFLTKIVPDATIGEAVVLSTIDLPSPLPNLGGVGFLLTGLSTDPTSGLAALFNTAADQDIEWPFSAGDSFTETYLAQCLVGSDGGVTINFVAIVVQNTGSIGTLGGGGDDGGGGSGVTIDELDAASTLDGTEEVAIEQSGVTVKTTTANIAALGGGGGGVGASAGVGQYTGGATAADGAVENVDWSFNTGTDVIDATTPTSPVAATTGWHIITAYAFIATPSGSPDVTKLRGMLNWGTNGQSAAADSNLRVFDGYIESFVNATIFLTAGDSLNFAVLNETGASQSVNTIIYVELVS